MMSSEGRFAWLLSYLVHVLCLTQMVTGGLLRRRALHLRRHARAGESKDSMADWPGWRGSAWKTLMERLHDEDDQWIQLD